MLFSSSVFVFLFLPLVLALFLWLQRRERVRVSFALLVAASLLFYAWWKPLYLPILIGSILFNFAWGRWLAARPPPPRARLLLALGIAANLALLGWFKYAGFFVGSVGAALGTGWRVEAVLLPLGISFFTFQQIAYLVDTFRGATRRTGLLEYALFVSFFPQLIAGPIVHHGEMLGQFVSRRLRSQVAPEVLLGLSVFAVGLFKKTVVADGVAPYADTVFALAGSGEPLDLLYAWSGALAYTLQLYFDFSGYSDMAIGLGLLFGIRLPLNFDSPYRAASIIDFWRRWHMTLSRFLRDYLYFPLGGGRGSALSRYRNLMLVMLLGGLWHGAGWTFVAWGGLHGLYLLINHGWRAALGSRARPVVPLPAPGTASAPGSAPAGTVGSADASSRAALPPALTRALSIGVTFLAVVVAWVFFRAEDATTASRMLLAMAGAEGVVLPPGTADASTTLGALLAAAGVREGQMPGLGPVFTPFRDLIQLFGGTPSGELIGSLTALATLAPLLLIVFLAPNTQTLFPAVAAGAGARADVPHGARRYRWRPSFGWSLATAALAAYALFGTTGDVAFLYFNF